MKRSLTLSVFLAIIAMAIVFTIPAFAGGVIQNPFRGWKGLTGNGQPISVSSEGLMTQNVWVGADQVGVKNEGYHVVVLDVITGKSVSNFKGSNGIFSPDGSKIAFWGYVSDQNNRWQLRIFDLYTKKIFMTSVLNDDFQVPVQWTREQGIVFQWKVGGQTELRKYDPSQLGPDPSGPTNYDISVAITDTESYGYGYPFWSSSPKGFVYTEYGQKAGIYFQGQNSEYSMLIVPKKGFYQPSGLFEAKGLIFYSCNGIYYFYPMNCKNYLVDQNATSAILTPDGNIILYYWGKGWKCIPFPGKG